MWNNNLSKKFYWEHKTDNQRYMIISVGYNPAFSSSLKLKYESLVFSCKLDGSPDIDRVIETRQYEYEEEAMLGHMLIWQRYNGEKND